MTNPIIHAAKLAEQLHAGQTRKYTGRPYIEHPARVAGRIARRGLSEPFVCAAWLHDVLEDCDVDFSRLLNMYDMPLDVCFIVHMLTNPSKQHPELNRAERKKMDAKHLSNTPREVRMIKLADRTDNLRELDPAQPFALQYLGESNALLMAFAGTDDILEKELYDEMGTLAEAIERAKAPPVLTDTQVAVAAVLEEKMGGTPDMLFDNNPDHYHLVTDMLPFFPLAGPAWKAVADRVLAHQKAKRAKKNT